MVEDLSRGQVMLNRSLRAFSKKIDSGSPVRSAHVKGEK
jgi:hypothetical protein